MRWMEQLDRGPKPVVAAVAVTITLIIAALDYATRTDASLSAVYIVPVSIAAIAVGPRFSFFRYW